jgi:ABC-2 type transport system permease protein
MSLLVYCLAALSLIWMYILLLPSMQDMAESFMKMLEGYPEAFLSMFPISEASFVSVENFLAMEYYSFMVPILIIVLTAGIAGSAISGEIEKGTAEILLAQPVSRSQIYLGQVTFGAFAVLLFSLFSTLAVIPIAGIYDVNYSTGNFFSMFLVCVLFGIMVLCLSMFFSALFSEKSRVSMSVGSIFVAMYVLYVTSTLAPKLEDIKYFSFFHYYDYESAVIYNNVSWQNTCVLLAASIIFGLAGMYLFRKRDIAI